MDYELAYGDEAKGVSEREISEWRGETSGVSTMGLFSD